MIRSKRLVAFLCLLAMAGAWAHVGTHPSVHDTVAKILERVKTTLTPEEISGLTLEKAESLLTEEERHVLATEHITFHANVPVEVYVIQDERFNKDPFWLKEPQFQPVPGQVMLRSREYRIWKGTFDAGTVGLGVNSLSGGGEHYFVAIKPQDPKAKLEITEVYPGGHSLGTLAEGEKPLADDDDLKITSAPDVLKGAVLLRGLRGRRNDAQILNVLKTTEFPSSDKPDHVVLTWSDDPRTTQTFQWRTSVKVEKGAVAYKKKNGTEGFSPEGATVVPAETLRLDTPQVLNDPSVNRHTVVLKGLEPATTYVYAVGDGTASGWARTAEFTTAPDGSVPFSFIYMGDAQNGLDRWGVLVHNAFESRPDVAFYVMAGDLVNRGAERNDWDSLFQAAEGVYDRRQLMPVLGNHEYQNGEPELYLKQFTLPTNGPATVPAEKAYSFRYSNALFLMLDSNLEAETQAPWIEEQLSKTDATWKFVVYHHPAYPSDADRENGGVLHVWTPIFDKYHVDLALQGHDHAYLRTYPMKGKQRAASAKEGTIYIVSNSGLKFYEQGPHDYTEVGMTNLSMYQVLDIRIDGNKLTYRAYDIDNKLRDEFVIEK